VSHLTASQATIRHGIERLQASHKLLRSAMQTVCWQPFVMYPLSCSRHVSTAFRCIVHVFCFHHKNKFYNMRVLQSFTRLSHGMSMYVYSRRAPSASLFRSRHATTGSCCDYEQAGCYNKPDVKIITIEPRFRWDSSVYSAVHRASLGTSTAQHTMCIFVFICILTALP
jgi:hypothetical protein